MFLFKEMLLIETIVTLALRELTHWSAPFMFTHNLHARAKWAKLKEHPESAAMTVQNFVKKILASRASTLFRDFG